MTLVEHALFRCVYRIEKTDDCHAVGCRKTVVADTLEEALARVQEHHNKCGEKIVFGEVVRESIQVWS